MNLKAIHSRAATGERSATKRWLSPGKAVRARQDAPPRVDTVDGDKLKGSGEDSEMGLSIVKVGGGRVLLVAMTSVTAFHHATHQIESVGPHDGAPASAGWQR